MNLYEQQAANRRKTWLVMLAFVTLVNLRGVRESGLAFMAPTYLFIISLLVFGSVYLRNNPSTREAWHTAKCDTKRPLGVFTKGASRARAVRNIQTR